MGAALSREVELAAALAGLRLFVAEPWARLAVQMARVVQALASEVVLSELRVVVISVVAVPALSLEERAEPEGLSEVVAVVVAR